MVPQTAVRILLAGNLQISATVCTHVLMLIETSLKIVECFTAPVSYTHLHIWKTKIQINCLKPENLSKTLIFYDSLVKNLEHAFIYFSTQSPWRFVTVSLWMSFLFLKSKMSSHVLLNTSSPYLKPDNHQKSFQPDVPSTSETKDSWLVWSLVCMMDG